MAKGKNAGRKADGNITIDLGEEIGKTLRSSGMAGSEKRSSLSRPGYRAGALGAKYRPAMFGYRPLFGGSGFGRSFLGAKMPVSVNTQDTLTGGLLGTVGNRLVVRFVPGIIGTNSRLAVEAVAFGVGLVPFLVRPNSTTVGVALPGLVFLAGSLADYLLDQVAGPGPALQGSRGSASAAAAARQRLAELHQRINAQRTVGAQRAVARPAYVG